MSKKKVLWGVLLVPILLVASIIVMDLRYCNQIEKIVSDAVCYFPQTMDESIITRENYNYISENMSFNGEKFNSIQLKKMEVSVEENRPILWFKQKSKVEVRVYYQGNKDKEKLEGAEYFLIKVEPSGTNIKIVDVDELIVPEWK